MKTTIRHWLATILCAIFANTAPAQSQSVCAQVKIEIEQELTLEREAFEARMTISNGLPTDLTNVNVTINFTDAARNAVLATSDPNNTSATFFLRLQDGSTIPPTITGSSSASIRWLIIPSRGAGGSVPAGKRYNVGATLTYEINSEPETVAVSPDTITVRPMPALTLDYFLPLEVNGDDPFTAFVEEAEPFSLGVRVQNNGSGTAKAMKIESNQPKIVDNRNGLLVNFQITGSEVNGKTARPSLLVDFGDIEAGTTGTARWIMTSSLYGHFTQFQASFSHADGLGGTLTSLIETVETHTLLHDVLVDLPGRDSIRDFLAYDTGNGTGNLFAYETDNVDTPVNDISGTTSISGQNDYFYVLGPPVTGLAYMQVTDPHSGSRTIVAVQRDDGKNLPVDNFWLSKTYDKNAQTYDYYLNLFDTGNPSGLGYNVQFATPVFPNRPPKMDALGDRIFLTDTQHNMVVVASDPDADTLMLQATGLPAGASFQDFGNNTGQLSWMPGTQQAGLYLITFIADDGEFTDSDTANIIVVGDHYEGWTKLNFPGETDTNIIGRNADPDGDGLKNLFEWATAGDPSSADEINTTIRVHNLSNVDYPALVYRRNVHAQSEVSFSVLTSPTLASASWAPLTQTAWSIIIDPDGNLDGNPDLQDVMNLDTDGILTSDFYKLELEELP